MSLISLSLFNRHLKKDNGPSNSEQDQAEGSSGAQNGNGATASEEPIESDTSLAVRRLKNMLAGSSETAEDESGTSETEAVDEPDQAETPADAVSLAPEETATTLQDDAQVSVSAVGQSSSEQSSEAEPEAAAATASVEEDSSAHESDLSELRSSSPW